MSDPLDIEPIEQRLKAATPGPWEHGDRWHVQGAAHCQCRPTDGPLMFEGRARINGTMMQTHVHRRPDAWYKHGIYTKDLDPGSHFPTQVVNDTEEYGLMDGADAEFIAHAPEDIAALVNEVKMLRAERPALWDEGYETGLDYMSLPGLDDEEPDNPHRTEEA